MGEVWRALDTRLGREVALKTLLPALAENADAFRRLRTEAEITAQLRHPGVLCVIDAGQFPDGRYWYTMPIVEGRTFGAEVADQHERVRVDARPAPAALHHLMSQFLRICQIVAHAHERGVIHRDLKPANLMVGRFGEVFVMDWGLAKALDGSADPEVSAELALTLVSPTPETQYGAIIGTPAYMAPEQAAGRLDTVDRRSDVFSLGAVLWHLLTGMRPGTGDLTAPTSPLHPDAALWAIARGAMDPTPAARPADAGHLAETVSSWLDGAQRREAAVRHVEAAAARATRRGTLEARAQALRQTAAAGLAGVGPHADATRRHPFWALEDEAAALERQARVDAVETDRALRMALSLAPDLVQARTMLAEGHRARLLAAETNGDLGAAAEAEAMLRAVDSAPHTAWLEAGATLHLHTAPPGAPVEIARIDRVHRRLETGPAMPLGVTPLVEVAVPRGHHQLTVRPPGRAPMFYPISADREGVIELGTPDRPLATVAADALGPDDVFVPAGPFVYGGDPRTAEPLPRRVIWVDAFVVRRHPVTLGEIIEWLNDLVETGRADAADAFEPHLPPHAVGHGAVHPIPRSADGRRMLPADQVYLARWPAVDLTWHAAVAYAEWLAARTGRPWRLLHEVEREKAARGPDARLYPWGDFPDPSWFRHGVSHPAGPLPCAVDAYPTDRSPYGVSGLAGNSRDWCLNVWETDGGPFDGDRLVLERPAADDPRYRAVRGGTWNTSPELGRATERFVGWPGQRYITTGLRVGWSVAAGG
jgi:serine/threonine-protein kinase